jgi:hypothetical protein
MRCPDWRSNRKVTAVVQRCGRRQKKFMVAAASAAGIENPKKRWECIAMKKRQHDDNLENTDLTYLVELAIRHFCGP